MASRFAAVNVLGNTSHTMRRVPGILVAMALLCHTAAAQEVVHLRGLLDQCYGVSLADNAQQRDSIVLDRSLPDSVASAYLVCMQVAASPDTATIGSVALPSLVGTRIPISIRSRMDSLITFDVDTADRIDPTATYQLVVPTRADTIVVDSVVTARPWNGSFGGIIILEASDELVINDTITVKGLGYRGGNRSANGGECNAAEHCAPRSSGRTGGKGESLYLTHPECAAGYPAWATGGGGGGAHNCGGGGGGNGGIGGRGGDQYIGCGGPGFFGLPGASIIGNDLQALLPGGGGGGGHQNNNIGTDGASGGGVIVLQAPSLRGDRAVCVASGASVWARAANDGAGGGGAGGTIVVDVCLPTVPLTLIAAGGAGGTCDDAHGPGGGGGGGRILLHPAIVQHYLAQCTTDVSGGASGLLHGARTAANAVMGSEGEVSMLCSVVPVHGVTIDSAVGIGDMAAIRFEPRHSRQDCDVYVQHNITIEGGSVIPLPDSAFAATLLANDVSAWNRRTLTVQLRSTQAATLMLQGVLSRDTTSVLTVRSTLSGAETRCDRLSAVQNVTADACGSKLRPIVVGRPFRLRHTGSDAAGISYRIEAHRSAAVQLRLFNMQGQLAAEQTVDGLSLVEPGVYIHQGSLALKHVARGLYYLTAVSALGMTGVQVFWNL